MNTKLEFSMQGTFVPHTLNYTTETHLLLPECYSVIAFSLALCSAIFSFIQTLILSKLCFKNDINYSDIKSKGLDFIFHGMINQKKKGG